MIAVDKPPVWMDQGLCATGGDDAEAYDPEAWFPDPSLPDVIAESVCDGCPVLAMTGDTGNNLCLEWALQHDIRDGVWGGVSETRRDVMAGRPHADPNRGKVGTCPMCGHRTVSTYMKAHYRDQYRGIIRRGRDGLCENCLQQIRRDERRRAQG